MPTASRAVALSVMKDTRLVEEITLPSTPPAAVTNRMGPVVFRVSLVMV